MIYILINTNGMFNASSPQAPSTQAIPHPLNGW